MCLAHDEHCGRSLSHFVFLTLQLSQAVTARLRGKDMVRNLTFCAWRCSELSDERDPMGPEGPAEGKDIGVGNAGVVETVESSEA